VKIGTESAKRVQQYDSNNNLINEYKSITYASEKTGISICNISRVCNKKRKTAGKFIWKFV
jgi:hypothetical protein